MPDWSFMPDRKEKRDDWEVACVADVTAGAAVAGGAWVFSFRNGTYYGSSAYSGMEYDLLFLGGGIGLGGKLGLGKGAGLIYKSATRKSYSKIRCVQPFSVNDLGGGLGSSGRLTCLTPGIYKFLYISAYNTDGALFHSQFIGGWTVGAVATALVGTWQFLF